MSCILSAPHGRTSQLTQKDQLAQKVGQVRSHRRSSRFTKKTWPAHKVEEKEQVNSQRRTGRLTSILSSPHIKKDDTKVREGFRKKYQKEVSERRIRKEGFAKKDSQRRLQKGRSFFLLHKCAVDCLELLCILWMCIMLQIFFF